MSTDIAASAGYAASPIVPTRTAATTSTTGEAIPSSGSNTASAPHPSPVSLLDPTTGLVVLQFYNAKGVETSSLPTKQALQNYRLNDHSSNVFQPAIRDGTVPQSSPSNKASVDTTFNNDNAGQASVTVQDSGESADTTVAGNSSTARSFTTRA